MALTGTVLSSPAVQRKGTISMHPSRTPLTLALAALALTATACGSSEGSPSSDAGSGASSPAPAHDTTALALGARWLGSQVTEGTVHNEQYGIDDTGLAVDVALALHGVGEQEATVQAVSDRLAKDVATYTAPGFGTLTSAGATAKAVVLAEAVGADPSSYGGTDLVAQLEKTVADRGPAAGRIQDVLDPKERSAADYANVVGQAYAVQGLAAADSPEAGAATDFLLAQQCSGGWFRLDFSKDATSADQSCDADPSSKPDLDTTSFARAGPPCRRLGAGRRGARLGPGLAEAAAGEGRLVRRLRCRDAQHQQHGPGRHRAGRGRGHGRGRAGGDLGVRPPGGRLPVVPARRAGGHRLRRRRSRHGGPQGHQRQGRRPVPSGQRRRAPGAAVAADEGDRRPVGRVLLR